MTGGKITTRFTAKSTHLLSTWLATEEEDFEFCHFLESCSEISILGRYLCV